MEKKSWTQEKKRFQPQPTSVINVPSDDRTVAGDRGRKKIETKMSDTAEFRPLRRPLVPAKDASYSPGIQARKTVAGNNSMSSTKGWWSDIPQKQPPTKRHSDKHNRPSENKEATLSSLKLGSKIRKPDEEGYMPGRKPALEADASALMGRKRQVNIADYTSKLGGGAPGSKPFAAPEYSTGFFHHSSGSIPGSNIGHRGVSKGKQARGGSHGKKNSSSDMVQVAAPKNNAEHEEKKPFQTYEEIKRAQLLRAEIDEVLKLEAPATTRQVGTEEDDSDDDLL